MRRRDLLAQLPEALVDLDPLLDPHPWRAQLDDLCAAARSAFGAAACSIAELVGEQLRYLAAAGTGAATIVGTELPVTRGIGGFVAVTGQALAIDQPAADARFARDVAERTGYVPDTMLVLPVTSERGDVVGILTVLDRTTTTTGALELGSAFATLAAHALIPLTDAIRTSQLVLDAFVDAVVRRDDTLAPALRRAVAGTARPDVELAGIAAALNVVRQADPATRQRLRALIDELVDLSLGRRRR
ncbi:MAG: GAF domain-containing protein [Actinomycetota bacterium]|nr:GAF domain-containing protein [Acidimicrobiia bacterium]MDQ3468802.1 GAF domain-containing protein [Actinomycetota bacterium]